MASSNSTLLLTSTRGFDAGSSLFWSDGTTVTEIGYYDSNPNTLFPTSAVSLNGIEYINMVDTTTGSYAIWAYNGATATQITPSSDYVNTYNDTNAAFASSFTEVAYNNTLVFSEATLASNATGDDSFDSASLAVFDPTTGLVTQPSVPHGGLDPQDFATIGSTLYFEGYDTTTSAEAIYSFDGTTVTEIYNLHPTSNSGAGSVTGPLVAFNNNLYFGSYDETIYELNSLTSLSNSAANRSGSTASANQIADNGLIVAGNFLYFANQANGIYSLSTSNVLTKVLASSGGSIGFQPVNWNGQLYFFGGSGTQKFYTSTGGAATLSNSSVTGGTLDFVPLGGNLYFNRTATTQQYFNGTSVGAIAVPGNLGGNPLAVLPFTPTGWGPAVVPVAVTASGSSGTYNQGGTPVAVDPGLTITDTATNTLTSALVAITNLSFQSGDMLNFTNQNGIVGTYDANYGLLALNGSATVAQYQAALASVTFNITESVGGSSRTFDVGVGDNENNNSDRFTSTVTTSNTVVAPTVSEALVSDTGSSASDNITSNDTVTGTGNPGAVVTMTEGTTTLGTTTANSLGNWTFSAYAPALAQGSNTIVATQTNTAGSGSASLTFTLDTVAPVVSSIDTVGGASNSGGTEQFGVTFSESVTGVTTSAFTLAGTGGVTGAINSISGSGNSYTVTVTGVSGTGTLGLDLNSSGTGITDVAGNAISGGFTSGETFSIGPASGTPSISAPATATAGVGQAGAVGSVTIAESPTTGGETFTLIASDSNGTLAANTGAAGGGGTITPSGGGTTLTISGATLAQVNADLTTLTDTEPTTAGDTISYSLTDSNGGTANPASTTLTVNGVPTISAPGSSNVAQSIAGTVGTISVGETGNTTTSGETFSVVVSDGAGVLSANTGAVNGGGSITPSGGGTTLTLAGTLLELNADLTTLEDDDASTSPDTITVHASDSFGNGDTADASIPVTVSSYPQLTQSTIDVTVAQGASLGNLWTELVGNGVDPNPASLSIVSVGTAGIQGSVSLSTGTDSLVYIATGLNPATPMDSFTYTLEDGAGGTVTGTVDVTVTGPNLPTTVAATNGSTTTASGSGQRLISDGTGQTLNGSTSGGDQLFGGPDTTVNGQGSGNSIFVEPGNHTIDMGVNNNTLTLNNGNNSVLATGSGNTVTGGNGNVTVNGMTGTSTITLGNGTDTVTVTGGGNDITVGTGTDKISAGNGGNETVIAGDGANTLSGGGSGDSFTSGNGASKITATGAGATITVGSGNDTIQTTAGTALIRAGTGTDTIKFAGSNNDIINQGGTDTLTDTGTNNTIALPLAGQGEDIINGPVLSNGDSFDLIAALAATTWDQQLSDLGDYLSMGTSGSNALVQLSTTSGGTPFTIAVLNGQGAVSLSSFVAHALLT